MDLRIDRQGGTSPPPRRSPLKIVLTLIVGAIIAFGVLLLAVILWFFATCANNPDCLRFG